MEPALLELKDRDAVRRLGYDYARAVDRKDFGALAAVFSDNAVLRHAFGEARGHAAIIAGMAPLSIYPVTMHNVNNHQSWIDGDTARAETYCVASHFFHRGADELRHDWGIIYEDKLLRTADGWRISERVLNLQWTQEFVVTRALKT